MVIYTFQKLLFLSCSSSWIHFGIRTTTTKARCYPLSYHRSQAHAISSVGNLFLKNPVANQVSRERSCSQPMKQKVMYETLDKQVGLALDHIYHDATNRYSRRLSVLWPRENCFQPKLVKRAISGKRFSRVL